MTLNKLKQWQLHDLMANVCSYESFALMVTMVLQMKGLMRAFLTVNPTENAKFNLTILFLSDNLWFH